MCIHTLVCYTYIYEPHLSEVLFPYVTCVKAGSTVYMLSPCSGTVILNPNIQDSPSIMVRYKEFAENPVVFPKLEAVLEVASKEMASVSTCM